MTPSDEPVVGWRVWRLERDRLRSLAVRYVWQAEENEAVCLKELQACDASPGFGCKCGFWALRDPALCVPRARSEQNSVLGIIAGWGTVALHGTEGFRSQFAMVRCLLLDWPWDETLTAIAQVGTPVRWQRPFLPWHRQPSQAWTSEIRRAALGHRVPVISLTQAIPLGVLAELGVDTVMVSELEARLRRGHVRLAHASTFRAECS